MLRKKIFFIVLTFFSFFLCHNQIYAKNTTTPGYHEIIFSGTTAYLNGSPEFAIANSASTYIPVIGDSISIHFGATFYADLWISGEYFYTWNHDNSFDIFQITVNDGNNGYILDGYYGSDLNGYNSSFYDDFYLSYCADLGGVSSLGYLVFNHATQSGYFYMFSFDFTYYATLTGSHIITEP